MARQSRRSIGHSYNTRCTCVRPEKKTTLYAKEEAWLITTRCVTTYAELITNSVGAWWVSYKNEQCSLNIHITMYITLTPPPPFELLKPCT